MGFRKLVKGFGASVVDLERKRLGTRFADLVTGATPIAAIPTRQPVKIVGEVSAIRVVPRHGSPWLEVTVDDATGAAVATFTGRSRIRGVEPGRAIVLEGVAHVERQRSVLLNPAYTLLP